MGRQSHFATTSLADFTPYSAEIFGLRNLNRCSKFIRKYAWVDNVTRKEMTFTSEANASVRYVGSTRAVKLMFHIHFVLEKDSEFIPPKISHRNMLLVDQTIVCLTSILF
jgi:hypothetical protein